MAMANATDATTAMVCNILHVARYRESMLKTHPQVLCNCVVRFHEF
jgi:hypothetical protein